MIDVCVCVCVYVSILHTHTYVGTFRDFLLYLLLLTQSEDSASWFSSSGRGHVTIAYMITEVQETTLCLLI